ncbi:MAG: SOS response-associated peptidase [Planctomycetes bacterium]|nr:SOS response-associated peptidase [Planctomycetota bacterium]
MCGRYAVTVAPDVLAALFNLSGSSDLAERFNLAPSQEAPVIVRDETGEGRALATMRWGLVPSWARDSKIAHRTINARSETAAEKPSFRSAFKRRRCLVPASWFYEWQREAGTKVPYRIQRADGRPLAFAGLWERWKGSATEPPRTSFTVLTTSANDDVAPLHDRMPCLIEPVDFDRWLTPEVEDPDATRRLLDPAPAGLLTLDRVSSRLNSVRNEGAGLMTPDTLF